jgi:hypothetical protein
VRWPSAPASSGRRRWVLSHSPSPVGAIAIGRLAIADAVIRKLRAEEIDQPS